MISALFNRPKNVPEILQPQKLPSLDGLRGISILMVVIYHLILKGYLNIPAIDFVGPMGVNIFFVISGFLITTLCLKEHVYTGTISLKSFYTRRILRILPVAYLYIAVIAIINIVFKLGIPTKIFFFTAAFLMNILSLWNNGYTWPLVHYWSLSTEEQFYLFFPALIKKAFGVFVLIVILIPLIAPFTFYLLNIFPTQHMAPVISIARQIQKFQYIAVGCLFSVLTFREYLNLKKHNFIITIICLLLIICLKHKTYTLEFHNAIADLLAAICIGFVISANITIQRNLTFKLLNFRPLKFIGILSYSIYIWQQLFLANNTRIPFSKFPLNLLFLIIVPCLSFFFYERYFLKIKDKLKARGTQ